MSILFDDTHPEIEKLQIELLRAAPVWRKMQMVGELNAAVRIMAMSGLRKRFPGATEAQLRRKLADQYLGKELTQEVYGGNIDDESA